MMMNRLKPMIAALLMVGLAACASQAPVAQSGPVDCFSSASVANYAVQDRDTVNLRLSTNAYYQLKLLGVCPPIQWSPAVALKTQGTAQACTGTDVTIVTQASHGQQECAADSMRRLTPDEIAALPAGARP